MGKVMAWSAGVALAVAAAACGSSFAVSCPPAGPCTAGGYYTNATGDQGLVTQPR